MSGIADYLPQRGEALDLSADPAVSHSTCRATSAVGCARRAPETTARTGPDPARPLPRPGSPGVIEQSLRTTLTTPDAHRREAFRTAWNTVPGARAAHGHSPDGVVRFRRRTTELK